jgi:hypothetical protein
MSPHRPELLKIDNASFEIERREAAELRNRTSTRQRGGRVFLAATLLGTE